MATCYGAEAVGLPECGSLEVGKRADFVVVDPEAMTTLPSPDPVSAAVYALTPAAVRSVWIDGSCVARDGRVLAWDRPETVAGVRGSLERLLERAEL